jgi:hypothetical protein
VHAITVTLSFVITAHAHPNTHLFSPAVDYHQVCLSLKTVISTALPVQLSNRKKVETVAETAPALL